MMSYKLFVLVLPPQMKRSTKHLLSFFQIMLRISAIFYFHFASGQLDSVRVYNAKPIGVVSDSTLNDTLVVSFEDSLLTKFVSSVFGLKDKANSFKDSLSFDKFKANLIQHNGSVISVGHEYGLLRGYIDPEAIDPLQVFNVRGDVGIGFKNIPLLVSFNYSTWQNPLGVNNFFRITLDRSRFNNLGSDVRASAENMYNDKLKEVGEGKTDALKKMNFGEVLLQKYKRDLEQRKKDMANYEKELKQYDYQARMRTEVMEREDSIGVDAKRDSLMQKYNEAQAMADRAMKLYDSVQTIYQKAQDVLGYYKSAESEINQHKDDYLNKFNQLKGGLNADNAKNMGQDQINKRKGFGLDNIRNFELGLSYPNLSGLGNGGVPIKGLNLEIEKDGWYYAVCAGIMQNNLMMTTDATYNKFFNTQNLMNQFDFRNINERGLITNVKFGLGTVEKSHAFIGVSYLSNAVSSQFTNNPDVTIPSLGMELDFRYVPEKNDNMAFDLIYGKSSRYESVGGASNVVSSLFSNDRTHAALLKYTQRIDKIKTRIETSIRWIDPFADTRSYGVVQPNHARFETRTIHQLSKKTRFGLNYRQDRGNIVFNTDSTSQLHVGGFFLDGQISDNIAYFGSANYVNFQQITPNRRSSQVNYMLNGGIAASYKIFDTEHNLLVNYGDNLITDTSSTGVFRTLNIQKSTKLRRGSNTFLLAYFHIDDPALFQTSSYVVGDEFSWNFKKIKLTAGLKVAHNEALNWSWGGKLEATYRIAKYAELFVGAEKLILGEFFNNYNRSLYDIFPYAFTTRINFLLK